MQLRNTANVAATNGVKILVYGKAGRGKTVLCSTMPNPVIVSCESGLLSLSQMNLPYAEVRTMEDLHACYRWANESSEARQFESICLDSISEIAEVVLIHAKATVKDPRQAYGTLIDRMNDLIRKFRDLPRWNVYMSAKQEFTKDENTGVMINAPSMPGSKLGQGLPYFFDEVFQLDIGGSAPNQYRFLRTQPDFQNDAKDRSGRLDPVERPHLGFIIDKIAGRA